MVRSTSIGRRSSTRTTRADASRLSQFRAVLAIPRCRRLFLSQLLSQAGDGLYQVALASVLIFGVAANLVAAVGALGMGRIEDRIGPKKVIMISLIGLITTSIILLFAHGTTMFWVFGLILTLWVGPAQSSSRAFMARLAPVGREGEMFGLYATTGRAASFLAPGLFALFSGLFSDRVGIVGIALVLLAGAVLLARVKSPPRQQVQVSE